MQHKRHRYRCILTPQSTRFIGDTSLFEKHIVYLRFDLARREGGMRVVRDLEGNSDRVLANFGSANLSVISISSEGNDVLPFYTLLGIEVTSDTLSFDIENRGTQYHILKFTFADYFLEDGIHAKSVPKIYAEQPYTDKRRRSLKV